MIRDQETLNSLLDTITRFVRERLVPNEELVAETDEIPADIVADMKAMGLFGLPIPERFGGLELTMEEEVLAVFELCRASPVFRSLLGTTVGNALEVAEAIAYLRGDGVREPRQHEVTLALSAELLVLGGLAPDRLAARAKLQTALDSGAAAEYFARMVTALGGPADVVDRPAAYLAAAPVVVPIPAPNAGVIVGMQTRAIGMAVVELGGGRRKATDTIDIRVGLTQVQPLGTRLQKGDALAWVHAADTASAHRAVTQLLATFHLVDAMDAPDRYDAPTVIQTIDANPA